MRKRLDSQSGFTIIELLLAMVFFSFILIFATASYIQINRSFVRGANIKLVQEEARKVINEIGDAIREAGSAEVLVYDNDNQLVCPPANDPSAINLNNTSYEDPATSEQSNCRRRICVGDKRFAWNQAVINPSVSEHSWFEYVQDLPEGYPSPYFPFNPLDGPEPNPFSLVMTEGDGTTEQGCKANVEFLKSTDLVDSSRITVQDLDVYLLDSDIPNTYVVRVTLSTIDNEANDNQDIVYESVATDSEQDTAAQEYKGSRCYTDQGSLEFCYVETLSTIVTTR